MNKSQLTSKLALQQLARRASYHQINILQECFQQQLAFINSPSKRKALCCNRRAGKSFTVALYMIDQALKTPKGKFLYIGLTDKSAKNTMWTDIFETIITKYKLNNLCNFKETALEIKFKNGSTIFLQGIDATPKQMNRIRGQKYDLAAIDEVQDFTQDLDKVINDVLGMTLAQNPNAVICIAGTPGSALGKHYWWRVMQPNSKETEWERITWSWKDNISMDPKSGTRVCDSVQKYIDDKLRANPLWVNTPGYKREVLGDWVTDNDVLVYKFSNQNTFHAVDMTDYFYKRPTKILSLDLGYYDATAFVIGSYNKYYDSNLYILESYKKSGMTITAVANEIKRLDSLHHFAYIVVDAANSQAVEEMKQIHNLPLIAADKLGKEAHIALLNDDFITNNVRLDPNYNGSLMDELQTLLWDQKVLRDSGGLKHKEDPNKENHLTDALLYCHHFSRHYWYDPKKVPTQTPYDMGDILIESMRKQRGNVKHMRSYLDAKFEDK